MVEVRMLDAIATRAATEQSADVPEITSGFDDDFKEIVVVTVNGKRKLERKESPSFFVPSQIESPTFEALVQMSAGNIPNTEMTLVWARKDVESLGLIVPDTGECLVRVNDRIVSIRDRCGHLVQKIREPQGLFVTQVRPTWGLAGQRDLFLISLADREQGVHQ